MGIFNINIIGYLGYPREILRINKIYLQIENLYRNKNELINNMMMKKNDGKIIYCKNKILSINNAIYFIIPFFLQLH